MVFTKDQPHGPGRSVPMFIVVKCEDHSAIQAPVKEQEYIIKDFFVGARTDFDTAKQCDQIKSPKVYKSCLKMILQEK